MSTAVAPAPAASKAVDPNGLAAKKRFVEAFAVGSLDKLTREQQTAFLVALGDLMGLRADLGELMIYQGKPYVTFDGRVRQAMRTGLLVGLHSRPATPLERKNFGADVDEYVWIAEAHRRGATHGFRGWGVAGGKNEKNQQAGKTHPRQMARKRSRYDALRLAFPIAEEITEMHTHYIEAAEAQIQRDGFRGHPLAALSAGDPEDMPDDEIAGEEVAASADVHDHPTRRAKPSEDQIDRLLTALDHPHVTDEMRDRITTQLANKQLTGSQVESHITAIEAGLPKTSRAPAGEKSGSGSAPAGELGLGDTRRNMDALAAG